MKNLILSFGIVLLGGTLAFGQQNDPSYSVNNYKHPHKAAYAKKNKKDNSTVVVTNTRKQNDNYKQQFNKPKPAEKAVVSTKDTRDKRNRSYKHPYGL